MNWTAFWVRVWAASRAVIADGKRLMSKQNLLIALILVVGALGVVGILRSEPSAGASHDHEHGAEPAAMAGDHADHDGHDEDEEAHGDGAAGHADEHVGEAGEGPHGGRLLEDGRFALEVTIFEADRPPEFRLYPFLDGKPLAPGQVDATVRLTRLGGRTEHFSFVADGDYLRGAGVVGEPHSFDVDVDATFGDRNVHWEYSSPEARVTIPAALAAASGLQMAEAGPAEIRETLLLYGSIAITPGRERQVMARFPGLVREVRVTAGDRVGANQVLATVESNESLETYPVRAPIAGVVVVRQVNPGDVAGGQPFFTIADLQTVVAELAVFRRDLPRVKLGQKVRVRSDDGRTTGEGVIGFVSPVGSSASQTVLVRVNLDNADGRWQPGIFVTGELELNTAKVPVAIQREALQTWRENQVVFVNDGDLYEPRLVELGRVDGSLVEVLSGLDSGESYVAGNSFLVKADIGKSGAGHDH